MCQALGDGTVHTHSILGGIEKLEPIMVEDLNLVRREKTDMCVCVCVCVCVWNSITYIAKIKDSQYHLLKLVRAISLVFIPSFLLRRRRRRRRKRRRSLRLST
jgi:hypothetical protein